MCSFVLFTHLVLLCLRLRIDGEDQSFNCECGGVSRFYTDQKRCDYLFWSLQFSYLILVRACLLQDLFLKGYNSILWKVYADRELISYSAKAGRSNVWVYNHVLTYFNNHVYIWLTPSVLNEFSQAIIASTLIEVDRVAKNKQFEQTSNSMVSSSMELLRTDPELDYSL